jgi:chromosome segregation ATPase
MQKKRINLAKVYPKYFAASKRTEELAELTAEQEATLASVDSRIAELEEELEALKAGKATSEEEEEKAMDEEEDKKAANEEEEDEMAEGHDKEKKAASPITQQLAALTETVNQLKAALNNQGAANHTHITGDATSEGGGKKAAKPISSIEQELNRLHGIN